MDANYLKWKTCDEKTKREWLIKEFMVATVAALFSNPGVVAKGVPIKDFSEDAANIAEISADVYMERIGK